MNLYDKDDGFKRFTLEEANALLPEIIAVTEEAVEELSALRSELEAAEARGDEDTRRRKHQAMSQVFESWAQAMVTLGVYPKGYFTVDFKSPIPDTLFCWTYGETAISHSHKVYESFKDRRPIEDTQAFGFEEALN